MNKSHFRFSKKQRNGIFLLVLLVLILQGLSYMIRSRSSQYTFNSNELEEWRREVDSLAELESTKTYKLYPFNPNFISDYKGYTLGMTVEQIDALHKFRANNQWINSKEQFKTVTGVSQQWLDSISPFFKFPEWVSRQKEYSGFKKSNQPKTDSEKIDLNVATASQLQKVYGIGPTFSKRIVEYRSRIDGFAHEVELLEVYGIDQDLVSRILEQFTIKTPRFIQTILINEATSDQLVTIPYIDYELAYNIIEYRTLHEGISNVEELTKIEDFPENKIILIGLYLQF